MATGYVLACTTIVVLYVAALSIGVHLTLMAVRVYRRDTGKA